MKQPTIIFAGDSVTDCGRRDDPTGLGNGYPRLLAASPQLAGWNVLNRGVSGDRIADQRRRWRDDVVAEDPDVVSLLIGINNTWRRFDSDDPTSATDFEADYRACLEDVGRASLILVEPFLLPLRAEQQAWREDLESKIAVVHQLGHEFHAPVIATDAALNLASTPAELTEDGVHPTARGHEVLAMIWLAVAQDVLRAVESR